MFRVKARVPEALVTRYIERVKTGLTGMAYVKLGRQGGLARLAGIGR